jgi:hypothetical protein
MNEIPKLTRRRAVELAAAAGAAALLPGVKGPGRLLDPVGLDEAAQAATASCVLTPEKTEGPYFVDEKLNRSDIRSDPTDGSVEQGVALGADAGQGDDRPPAPRHALRRAEAPERGGRWPGARHRHVQGRSGRVQDRAQAHHDPEAAGLVAAEGGGSAAPFARRRVALLRSSPPRRSRAGPICRRTT